MKSKNLIVPIDFSDCSRLLVEEASALAKRIDGRLVLLHVTERPSGLPGSSRIHLEGTDHAQSVDDYLHRAARERLEGFADLAQSAGTPALWVVRSGDVASTILQVATEYEAEMIVMGTHGRTGVARAMLGSVAEVVLRRASCPVTTLRTQRRPSCRAKSCAWCASHVTDAAQSMLAEVDG